MSGNAKGASARGRSLGAIHAGKRALGWDDDAYRAFLFAMFSKSSASDLTDAELSRAIDAMRTHGFQRKEGTAPRMPNERATQLGKARALWRELEILGELKNPSDAGFSKYLERVTGRSRPEWCTPVQLSKAIEGLKAWLKRAHDARIPDDKRPIE